MGTHTITTFHSQFVQRAQAMERGRGNYNSPSPTTYGKSPYPRQNFPFPLVNIPTKTLGRRKHPNRLEDLRLGYVLALQEQQAQELRPREICLMAHIVSPLKLVRRRWQEPFRQLHRPRRLLLLRKHPRMKVGTPLVDR